MKAAVIATMASAVSANLELFNKFKADHGKTYESTIEEAHRYGVFKANLGMIDQLNSLEQGTATYGVTKFADLTADEFKEQYLGLSGSLPEDAPVARDIEVTDVDSIDWVEKGAVTPVKNQGQCGSCWAFSTTGNIEGVTFLKTGNLVSLSEQELVDCDKNYGDMGCQGGLPSNAYKFVLAEGGIDTESSYSYSGTGGTCKESSGKVGATISNWTAISTDETQIASQLVQRGPLSIGINAAMMQLYMGGVANPLDILCNKKNLDHGVLIVGYGTDSGKDYWKIKNSWGSGWGEKGYYRIIRGKGKCGLNTMVTSAIA
eukprot:g4566.t1